MSYPADHWHGTLLAMHREHPYSNTPSVLQNQQLIEVFRLMRRREWITRSRVLNIR